MTFDEFMLVMQDIVIADYSTHSGKTVKMLVKQAWDAATEEVKKDHFKIGEEVDILPEIRARVKAKAKDGTWYTYNPADVRRIPAWEPKDGEAVLAKSKSGKAFYAVSAGGTDIYDDSCPVSGILEAYDIKPWKPDCQGKPWDEV